MTSKQKTFQNMVSKLARSLNFSFAILCLLVVKMDKKSLQQMLLLVFRSPQQEQTLIVRRLILIKILFFDLFQSYN